MNTSKMVKLMAATVACLFISAAVQAEETTTTTSPTPAMEHKGTMMEKMDAKHMKGMMHNCMKTTKDEKVCQNDMMEKCQKDMPQGECQKMMTQAMGHKATKTK